MSLGPYVFSLKATNAQPSDDMCEKLPVVKIGANGVRGAASAEFAVDGDPVTRWANQAIGSFVQLDLGLRFYAQLILPGIEAMSDHITL